MKLLKVPSDHNNAPGFGVSYKLGENICVFCLGDLRVSDEYTNDIWTCEALEGRFLGLCLRPGTQSGQEIFLNAVKGVGIAKREKENVRFCHDHGGNCCLAIPSDQVNGHLPFTTCTSMARA
jgi:hypothetical protein